MSDLELRRAQRASQLGGVEEEARLIRARLRAGELDADRLYVAAALGHAASRSALQASALIPEPSRLRHWWRQTLQNAVNRISEESVPYTGELREWIQTLASLGPEACTAGPSVVVRCVADDWAAVSFTVERIRREPEPTSLPAAVELFADCAERACLGRSPAALREAIRKGLISWSLDEQWDYPRSCPKRETGTDDAPIVKVANRIVEDAWSREVTRIAIGSGNDDEGLGVRHLARGEESLRMLLPARVEPVVRARFAYMAGLDPLGTAPRKGIIEFQAWSRKALAVRLQVELSEHSCLVHLEAA